MSHRNTVIFDVDGTLTETRSIWQFIHENLGTWEKAGKYYLQQFLAGQISYEDFAKRDAREWKGVPLKRLEEIIHRVKFIDGAQETFKQLKNKMKRIFVISSGLDVLVKRILRELGAIYGIANELEIRHGKLTGKVKIKVPWDEKGVVLEKIAKTYNINLHQAVVVGDSETDISMFNLCGTSIAFNPSSNDVARAATHVIREKDLRKILLFL
ncbi:MAG: HAD family hydrolase [Candidatus Heimdallarchaeota archaeon]